MFKQGIYQNSFGIGLKVLARLSPIKASPALLLALTLLAGLSTSAMSAPVPNDTISEQKILIASKVNEEKGLSAIRRGKLWRDGPPKQVPGNWAIALDNDILVPSTRDQDYTGGASFTYTGDKARSFPLSLARALGKIDSLFKPRYDRQAYSLEFGLFGFTPENIGIAEANSDDRPYASLIYLTNSRERINLSQQSTWQSSLTLGVLGLDIVGDIQNEVHSSFDSEEAQGWGNQISDGGELTARYTLAYQKLLPQSSPGLELKSTQQISLGYITEANWSLSFRAGRINTGWWSFDPELVSYGEQSAGIGSPAKRAREHYFWGGLMVKARAYNAFLQGQFRDSAVSYEHDELNHVLLEGWLGYTLGFGKAYRFSYVLRGHTSEIKAGAGDRDLLWGGIILAKNL